MGNRADEFLELIKRDGRGRLKVYLGYAPGVGKTYQMLQEAHRLKAGGVDVVVGFVETHGRPETAKLLEGLEVLPRRAVDYQGVSLSELDCEALLQRKPAVALIDEIAHTNVPGSQNTKRYEDINMIRHAGIHVITTLNIQHLESLCDTVEKMVGIHVRERIPDSVLSEADQIVTADLEVEDLLKRMNEGKIYAGEKITNALRYFFQASNLTKLRELTLRELASRIGQRREEIPSDERDSMPDQVMVCLSSRGGKSESLLRYASRLAGKLDRNWYAVYIQTPREDPTRISAADQRHLSNTLTLARELGAIVMTYIGSDVAGTILHFAAEYGVGHIVIGRSPNAPIWKRILGQKTVVEELLSKSKTVNIVVVSV